MGRKNTKKSYRRGLIEEIYNSAPMPQQPTQQEQPTYEPSFSSGMSRDEIANIYNSYTPNEIPKLEEQNTTPTPSISDELKRMEKAKSDTTTQRTPGEQQAIDTYYNSLLEASGKQPSTSAPTSTPTTPSSVDYRAELDRVRAMKSDTTTPRTEGENQAIDTYLASLEEAQRYLDSQKPITTKSVKKSGSNNKVTNKSVKNIGTVEVKADGTKNYTKTMSPNEQRDYERALLAQSKARGRALSPNEQRDLERAQNAIAQAKEREKVTTESKNVALSTTAKENSDTTLERKTLTKATATPVVTPTPDAFHEATQEIIDNQSEKQKSDNLKFNPMTGKFENDYDRVRRAMEVVGTSDYNSESKFVDRALDPDYKLTGSDKKRAKQIVKDYFNENETAKKINKTNNANAAMAMFNQMSDEEKAEYSRMSALSAKTSPVTSTALGMVGSIPFLGALEDYTAEIAGVPEEYNFSAMKKQAQTQNPLLYMGGDMATKVAEYSTLTPVLEQIPALATTTNGLGTALAGGNATVGNAIGNVLRGTVADIALDTIPREIENVQNGYNFADVATDAAGNIALNTLYNAGAEAIPYLASGVKNLFKGATPSNELNPLEMAAKNAEGIDDLANQQRRAVEEITNLNVKNNAANPIDNGISGTYDEIKGGLENGTIQTGKRYDGTGSERILRKDSGNGSLGSRVSATGVSGGEYLPSDRISVSDNVTKNPKIFDDNDIKNLTDANIPHNEYYDLKDPDTFSKALATAKANNPHGGAVDAHTAEDIQDILNRGGKTFLTADGTAGGAVDNGNLTAVFKDNLNNDTPRAASTIAIAGVKNGANKGDCFGRFLVNSYSRAGFEPVARVKYAYGFNDEMDRQVREQLASGLIEKEPDVYALKLIDGYDYNKAIQNYGKAKKWTQQELDSLPLFEGENSYDDMLNYRDSLIKKQPTSEGASFLPKNGDNFPPVPPSGGNGGSTDEIIPRGKVSQFATNSMKKGTNLTPEEYEKNVNLKDFIYQNKTEEQSMKDAFKMIEDEGVDNLKARLLSDEAKDLTQSEIDALMSITRTNNATARAMELVGEDASALRAETTEIYKKLRQQSTSNAQALQALAKWSRNTPEGMLMQAENIVSGNIKAKESKLQEMLKKLSKLKKQYDFSPEFEANFLKEAEKLQGLDIDSREAKDIMARLGSMVNDEIPVKLNEKVQAFLMDNMLGNFRTLITRNAGGNVGLAGVEQIAERPLAAGIDRLVSHVTGKRTQAGLSREGLAEYISGFRKGLADEAHDLKTGLHTARTGENTLENAIRSNRHVFKNAIQDKADSLVKNGLSVGDRPFYEANYKQTLGDYYRLREKGVMGDVVQNLSDAEFKMYAETAAKLNSLAAVYQNDSQISNALLGFKNAIGEFSEGTVGFDILSQFSMPFVKTPANVVDRAIDYSPLGIVRNTARTIREGGFKGANFDQNRFVNETARNILGTGLMGGAAALANNGAISGSYSDKNNVKQAQKDSGMQEYALNLPNNMQMDIGWLPVVGSNAVAAAAAVDAFKNGEGSLGQNLTKGVTAGGEALFDQSMFQGLQRLFGSGESYNSDKTLPENMIEVVKSGIGQAIPSLLRQSAQVSDKYARDLGNSNKDLAFGLMDNYNINSLINNIPVLRQNALAPKVDLSGNLVEENQGRGLGSKILEDMILPGKLTEINVNPLDQEAIRLSEATGNEDAYRPKASRSAVDVGETSMTNKEWVDYEQRFGKEVTATGNAIMQTELYQNADDLTKEKMLNDSYNAVKNAINSEYTGKDVSGSAKAYKEAGGGEKGIEAVVNSVLGKSLTAEAGATTNSQTGKMIQEAVQSGDTQKAEEIVETAKTLADYGLDKPSPTATYTKAQEVIPSLTIEEFATTYKKIDSDNNQGIKQDEIITYLNNGSYSQTEGSQIWNAYGSSGWKKIPKLENGTWKLSKK